jgi:hypothetical protein
MTAVISVSDRIERFKAYYNMENDRKLLGFFVGSEFPLKRYEEAKNLPEHRPLAPEDFSADGYAKDCSRLFDLNESYGGDFIWGASAFWGIPWVEAAMGLDIIADHISGSIHSRPVSDVGNLVRSLNMTLNNKWTKKLVEFLKVLNCESGGRFPIGITRMRGISDLLAAAYGGEEFLFKMLEEPDEVHEVCEILTNFWITLANVQLDNIPEFHGGIGSFYYNLWVPKRTVWHQEDAVALLSPELFDTFIRPCDEKIVAAFNGCIIHQHPGGYMPSKTYMDMGVTALEIHVDDGGQRAEDLYERHMEVLSRKPLLIWGKLTDEDLDYIFEKLPDRGLAVQAVVETREEAERIFLKYIG